MLPPLPTAPRNRIAPIVPDHLLDRVALKGMRTLRARHGVFEKEQSDGAFEGDTFAIDFKFAVVFVRLASRVFAFVGASVAGGSSCFCLGLGLSRRLFHVAEPG